VFVLHPSLLAPTEIKFWYHPLYVQIVTIALVFTVPYINLSHIIQVIITNLKVSEQYKFTEFWKQILSMEI